MRESGLLETREVALVPLFTTSEVWFAEQAITIGDEHEKDNCHTWLSGDCAPGIRTAEFDR